jgi:hypothetical protein
MKTYLSLAAAGILMSGVALAQNAKHNDPAETAQAQAETAAQTSDTSGKITSIRQDLRNDLQSAGFTNVRVIPDSFLVQAKDRSGQPVAMIINPHSMTEIVDEGSIDESGSKTAQAGAVTGQMAAGTSFTTVPENERLSSKLVGTDVYNDDHQDIGTIKDIAYGRNGVKAYILGVGGFLGMGDHYVAVRPSALQVNYDSNAKAWRATMNTTAQELKSAPEYKYPTEG